MEEGMYEALGEFFHLTPTDYLLLIDCQRDDIMKYGLDPRHATQAQKPHLYSMQQKGYVEYSYHTGKWELLEPGKAVIVNLRAIAAKFRLRHRERGKLLKFPPQPVGNSA
jgi:hypothetical protein